MVHCLVCFNFFTPILLQYSLLNFVRREDNLFDTFIFSNLKCNKREKWMTILLLAILFCFRDLHLQINITSHDSKIMCFKADSGYSMWIFKTCKLDGSS